MGRKRKKRIRSSSCEASRKSLTANADQWNGSPCHFVLNPADQHQPDQHVRLVQALTARPEEHGTALNPSKKVFAQQEAKFGGYIVDGEGFRPDPELTRAIRDYPITLNMTDLRPFFGWCQQVRHFSDQIVTELLVGEWTTFPDEAFKRMREKLFVVPDLAFCEPAHRTALHVDTLRRHSLGVRPEATEARRK